jgi:hypothetical protein
MNGTVFNSTIKGAKTGGPIAAIANVIKRIVDEIAKAGKVVIKLIQLVGEKIKLLGSKLQITVKKLFNKSGFLRSEIAKKIDSDNYFSLQKEISKVDDQLKLKLASVAGQICTKNNSPCIPAASDQVAIVAREFRSARQKVWKEIGEGNNEILKKAGFTEFDISEMKAGRAPLAP